MARSKLEDLAQRIDQKICSEDLVFFVCSLYLPLCVENQDIKEPIKPCREVCEKVKSDCDATVKSIARANDTSHELDCGQLVTYDEGVCLTPRAFIRPSSKSRQFFIASICNYCLSALPCTASPLSFLIISVNVTIDIYSLFQGK